MLGRSDGQREAKKFQKGMSPSAPTARAYESSITNNTIWGYFLKKYRMALALA